MSLTEEQIRAVPKVLLHDHLDGGLRPSTVIELAQETGYGDLPTRDPEELTKILAEKISLEKSKLEKRLAQLSLGDELGGVPGDAADQRVDRPRRKYPKVLPKYFNPSAPLETWSGRGKQPRWVVAALRSGHKLEDLRIPTPKEATGTRVRRGHRS